MGQTHGAFGYSAEESALDPKQSILSTVQLYFRSIHTHDRTLYDQMFHPQGHVLGPSPEGVLVDRDSEKFWAGIVARTRSDTPEYIVHDRVLSVMTLDDCTAAVKVQIALPAAPDAPTPTYTPTLFTDFLVLLKEKGLGWRVISKIFSGAPLGDPTAAHRGQPTVAKKVDPSDFEEATKAIWEGYFAAARAGNAKHMASIFHPACNLNMVVDGEMVVIPSEGYCKRNGERWQLPLHKPYSHLKADPRTASADTLKSLDFAGPGVALAQVQMGLVPRMYTDFLSMVYLPGGVPDLDSKPAWWIVSKSCCFVPFMEEEICPELSNGVAN